MSSTANANSAALSDNAAAHTSAATNQRVFSDLDIDDLSPLPPAHGFSNARSASLERIPSLKLNVTPGTGPSYQASSIVGASPALSAAPSSFRLEASPPSSPQASRSPRQHPHSYPQQQTSTQHDIASASQPSSLPPPQQHPVDSDTHYNIPADQAQSQMPSVTVPCPSARYVTVSAILSRSEMYYAPDTSDHWDILRSPQGFPIDAQPSHTRSLSLGSYEPSSSLRRRRSQRKRPSNGSAIEALGALLLHKDSSGRVANLSFARDEHSGIRAPKTQSADSQTGRQDPSPKHGVQAWTSALSSLGRSGLRLQLPYRGNLQPFSSSKSATIAERRAQMCDRMLTRQGAVVEDTRNGFSKVRSRRGGLSFEVGNASHKQTPSTLLQLEDYRPEGKGKMTGLGSYDELGNDDELILQAGIDTTTNEASIDWGRLPETIVLKAGRRPRPGQHSRSEFGIGSAVHDQTLPEAPPSPVAMPGAWHGGSSWRSKPGDGYEEGALLLPPPLLDDNGSDASSFEGLLGVRRMREREKARKQAEKLAARNRPTHKVGPLTALTNFVKAAHAAESFAKRTQAARRSPQAPAYFRSFTEPKRPPRVRSGSTGSLSSAQTTKLPKEDPDDAPKMLKSELADITLSALPTSLATAAVTPAATDTEAHTSPAVNSASPFMSPSLRKAILSRRGSRNNSIDAAGRQLNTVFEFEPLDPSQIPDDELASPDLPPISSPLLRPSSISSSKTTALRDFPAAPRLLPVQLSMPPSPFTPLGIDLREPRSSIGPAASSNGDYLSARNVHSSPRTPHLVPTMLSLPPSPWTPYQHASAMHSSPMVHLHLNTSSSSLRLAPGTPRLVPTHIEIVPSPVQTTASSHRGSLTYDSPRGMRAIGMTRSPLTGPATDYTSFAALSVPEAESIDSESGGGPTPSTAQDGTAENKPPSKSAETKKGSLRLTPSSMLVAAQSAHAPIAEMRSDSKNTGVSNTSPTTNASKEAMPPGDRKIKSSDSRSRRSSADHGTFHVDSSGRQRSFVLWFLIGDLGLRGSTNLSSSGNQEAGPDHGGVAALFVHTFSFLVFVAAHLVDLGYSLYERISLFLWFLRWILYNLTGQTVLAQCAVEAYCFIQAEWATVAMEDHEEKGSMKAFDHQGHRKPKGLSRWQVLRGFLELYCLHSVTRERYLAEGAGLKELDGWRRPSTRFQKSKEQKLRGSDRLDIGAHRAASRAAFAENRTKWAQDPMLDFEQQQYETADFDTARSDPLGDGEVSRPGSDVRSRPESDRSSGGEDDCRHDEDDANDVENEDEGDDSSDDEMIVTNRGDDILEFAKTPRIDATRPGQASTGYFGRAYDFMTSPEVSASLSKSENRDLRPFKETNRDLVRTIKWCGRLAISAYGLHVHIVDLPPTFTPSGDRFSRQTFAYLSRLNAEDVLHADIQTLDADADYSPTFYIVRDYVRKVVCVAVRGTQSFSDIIVDLELQTEEIELPQVQPTPGEEFRCHAGIWRAAKALVSPQSKLFATLRQALAENEGFGVMFCGHSLGGAIASAAALLLAEYFIPDGAEPDAGIWVTNMSSGLPARRPIRAVSFASPVTMTADLASRAALGSVPLVTTVVLGSDVIPRVGHGQVRELRRVLGALSRVRRRHAMASTEGQDDARVHILRSFWDWRSIRMAENPDDVMLHRKERIEEQLWSLRCEVESDLYAAIKARLDAESTSGAPIPPSPWVGPEQRDQAPLHALSARRQGLDTATLRSEAAQGGPLVPPGRCIWINDKHIYHVESPLAFFSLPELRGDMFAAHFPAAYEEAILELRT